MIYEKDGEDFKNLFRLFRKRTPSFLKSTAFFF